MKKYFSILPYLSFSAFLYSFATMAASPVKTDVSAGYTYDDNVTRAEFDNDIEKDNILNLDASARYNIPVNNKSYFSVKGTLEINQYLEYSKLSNTRLGIHGSYHIRPFSGYTATSLFALASYERRLYDSDLRDGSATHLQLGLSKRLTDRVKLFAGYIKEDIDAESIVFDADNNRLYLDFNLRLNQKNTLYTTLGYLDGDLVTTARSGIGIVYDYWVIDDAFTDLSPTRWAYKQTGNATTIRLGDNYAFGANQAIDGSVLFYDSKSDAGGSYSGMIVNLNYLYRF
jgi:hypothetical protein